MGGGSDTEHRVRGSRIRTARKEFGKGEERPTLPSRDQSPSPGGRTTVERGFEIEFNPGWQMQCLQGPGMQPSWLD